MHAAGQRVVGRGEIASLRLTVPKRLKFFVNLQVSLIFCKIFTWWGKGIEIVITRIMNRFYSHTATAAIFLIILAFSSCIGPRTAVHIDEDDIPDMTLAIIVRTEMDHETAFETVSRMLHEKGYDFRTDAEILNGPPVDIYGIAERWDADFVNLRLEIAILGESDVEITFRGWYYAPEYEGHPEEIEQQIVIIREGFGGPTAREAWIEMFDLASEIDGIMRFEQ